MPGALPARDVGRKVPKFEEDSPSLQQQLNALLSASDLGESRKVKREWLSRNVTWDDREFNYWQAFARRA